MAEIGETELDMRALARALWRWSWLLVLLAIGAAGATYFGLGYVDPLYTADTSILIEDRESPLTRPRDTPPETGTGFDESAIQSQVEVLRSREIADAVIDKLDLTRRPEFDPARRPSLVRSIAVTLGIGEDPLDSSIRQRVMESYFERLAVFPLQRSRVIGVEFSAPNPQIAAEVANAVADAFVLLQQDAKRQSAIAATAWLEQEIERLRQRVAESEQAVADYRTTHGLFDVDQRGAEPGGNLSTQQLGDINAELARARAARAEAEARAELIQNLLDEGGPIDASEEVLSSQLIQRLRERQVALRAQVAELSTTLLPGHPRIRALEGQVANLEAQIREEAAKVLTSLQTAARVAAAREQSLVTSLNEAKVDVSRANDQGIELRALEREATAQRGLLESFLGRYREAAARTDANYLPADARIISRAVAPTEPSFPKKTMMALAAAIAVFLIGSTIVLFSQFISGRAFRVIGYGFPPPREAADVMDVAIVAVTSPAVAAREAELPDVAPSQVKAEPAEPEPVVEAARPVVVMPEAEPVTVEEQVAPAEAEDATGEAEAVTPPAVETALAEPEPESTVAETPTAAVPAGPETAMAEAAPAVPDEDRSEGRPAGTSGLADILANDAVRVALFSGAEGGEGAGEIAFSAARIAAEQKLRCIIVDVGRKPSEALGLERPGLGDLLAGEAAFGEVIRRDEDAHVHVIPVGALAEEAPLQRMQLVVGALTHTYDKVIVVSDRLDDWPHEHVRPDIAAIVCAPDTTEFLRTEAYDVALARGAKSAIIVRLSGDDLSESEAA
ncbi:MAG: Wzz/FepE/Etk N-terminal domain-containing protein [Propylenella sp.]